MSVEATVVIVRQTTDIEAAIADLAP